MDTTQKKAAGQRGKVAEKKVREFLSGLSESNANFEFERKYDARSAGGRFQSQTGDFGFYILKPPSESASPEPVHGVIEVKEVAHDFRLPSKNMTVESVARMRMRQLAGGQILIVVYHTNSKLWRVPRFETFLERSPSWDLSAWPTYASADAALRNWALGHGLVFFVKGKQ